MQYAKMDTFSKSVQFHWNYSNGGRQLTRSRISDLRIWWSRMWDIRYRNDLPEEGSVVINEKKKAGPMLNVRHSSLLRQLGANDTVYHGEEAEWLRLQALQLMLRLQVAEIRRLWDLPEVLEVCLVPRQPKARVADALKDHREGALGVSTGNLAFTLTTRIFIFTTWLYRPSRRGQDG